MDFVRNIIDYTHIFSETKIFGEVLDSRAIQKEQYIAKNCCEKTVLHVGCTDSPITEEKYKRGMLLHSVIEQSASSVLGIDISRTGLDFMRENGFSNVIFMDAEKIESDQKFDVVVAGDLLEHLSSPGLFLKQIPDLLNPGGELIISVPNAYCKSWAESMWYKNHEIVHKDHCCYYSPKTLSTLCGRFDLLPKEIRYLFAPRNSWKGLIADMVPGLRRLLGKRFVPSMAGHFAMIFGLASDVDTNVYYTI